MSRLHHHRADLLVSLFVSLTVANCRPPRPSDTSGHTATNTVTNTGTVSDTGTGSGSGTGMGSDTGTVSDTGTGTGSDTVTVSEPVTMTNTAMSTDPICGGLDQPCCAGSSCNGGCCAGGRCAAKSSDGTCPSVVDAGNGGQPDAPQNNCTSAIATPCTGLPAFTGSQTVDGNDQEFCSVPSFELNFNNAASDGGKVKVYNGTTTNYPERAVARVAWDATGIHAFIHVIDPTYTPATSLDTIYNADGIELLFTTTTSGLSGETSKDSSQSMHVIVSPPFAARSKASGTNGTQEALPAGQFSASAEKGGYKVELQLPWPGTPPTAGSQIKFDMELNAADGISTNGDLGPRDAQAILYLGSDPGGSPCAGELFPYCDDRLWCSTTLQ